MKNEKTVVDIDYAEAIVPKSARRGIVTMFMIMLGFTFFKRLQKYVDRKKLVILVLVANMYYPYYFDPTYFLVIIGVIICALASAKVNSTYARYDQVRNHAGITGAMAAEQILRMEGISDVQVMRVSGKLTDHYDPANHVLRLSDSTYGSTSVAALGVAAHECGHAIQHARHYVPLTIRGALVPVANFGSGISWPLIIMGLFIRGEMSTLFINLGILMFSLAVLFQIITLPVEFNASGRALKILKNSGMLYESEVREARSVLTAAALTYVASAASALLQLLRILILTGGRRNDDE